MKDGDTELLRKLEHELQDKDRAIRGYKMHIQLYRERITELKKDLHIQKKEVGQTRKRLEKRYKKSAKKKSLKNKK